MGFGSTNIVLQYYKYAILLCDSLSSIESCTWTPKAQGDLLLGDCFVNMS